MTPIVYAPEMAEILGKTPSALRMQLQRNPEALPPSFMVGTRRAWTRDDINKWIEDQKAEQARRENAAKAIREALENLERQGAQREG